VPINATLLINNCPRWRRKSGRQSAWVVLALFTRILINCCQGREGTMARASRGWWLFSIAAALAAANYLCIIIVLIFGSRWLSRRYIWIYSIHTYIHMYYYANQPILRSWGSGRTLVYLDADASTPFICWCCWSGSSTDFSTAARYAVFIVALSRLLLWLCILLNPPFRLYFSIFYILFFFFLVASVSGVATDKETLRSCYHFCIVR